MKITLLAVGSRGDVQPYVALALGLKEHGHHPILAAPENFKNFVEGFGLQYAPLAGDTRSVLDQEEVARLIWEGKNYGFFAHVGRLMESVQERYWDDMRLACEGADVVLSSPVTEFLAQSVAEAVGAQCVLSFLAPLAPSYHYASFAFPFPTFFFPPFNRLSHALVGAGWWRLNRNWVNRARRHWGLGPLGSSPSRAFHQRQGLTLMGFSPYVFSRPPDWPESHVMTGAWHLSEGTKQGAGDHEDAGFREWLENGPPPIYFGFGSMPVPDHEGFMEMSAELCDDLGMRALIGAGWTDIRVPACDLPDNMAIVEQIDHAWLFPQCAAVVHHGGAGTTHAGLRSGVPNVVCSFFADQPFWGRRVQSLGAGSHLHFRDINYQRLKSAILDALSEKVQNRAAVLGSQLRQERGVEEAVAALERFRL